MKIKDKKYVVEMEDGSRWAVPVPVIATHRASCYAEEFNGDVERSLEEDTYPLFEADAYECADWAKNNMNWEDIVDEAVRVVDAKEEVDYQEGWVNGDWEIE